MQTAKKLEDPSEPALYHQWRVTVDEPGTIHVEDMILVRLQQVSLSHWVPVIDVLRTV